MLSSNAGSGDPGLPQQVLVDVEREPATLAKSRVGGDPLEDLGVRDTEVQVRALLLQQALAEQLLQQVVAHFRIVEDRRIDALRAAPQILLLVADRVGEFGLGDHAAVEFRDLANRVAGAEVVVDAEERERNHDQRQDELRDPLVLVNEIKHRPGPIL